MLEAIDLGTRHSFNHRFVSDVHCVVEPWDRLGSDARDNGIHLRAQSDEFDNRIALCLVLEEAYLAGVVIVSGTSEAVEMTWLDFAEIESVI